MRMRPDLLAGSEKGTFFAAPAGTKMPDMRVGPLGTFEPGWLAGMGRPWVFIGDGTLNLTCKNAGMLSRFGASTGTEAEIEIVPAEILREHLLGDWVTKVALGWESADETVRFYASTVEFFNYRSHVVVIQRSPMGIWLPHGDIEPSAALSDYEVIPSVSARLIAAPAFEISIADGGGQGIRIEGDAIQKHPNSHEGAYRGWRAWKRDEHVGDRTRCLKAITQEYCWSPGWNRADNYKSPYADSRWRGKAGFYLINDFYLAIDQAIRDYSSRALFTGKIVFGSALAAGKMVKATQGCRAQYAKPETILLTGDLDVDAELLTIADEYGMTPIGFNQAAGMPTGIVPHSEPG